MSQELVSLLTDLAKKDKNVQALLSGKLDSIDVKAVLKLAKEAGLDVDEQQVKTALKLFKELEGSQEVKGILSKLLGMFSKPK